jgi:hypothetical protein
MLLTGVSFFLGNMDGEYEANVGEPLGEPIATWSTGLF